MDQENATTQTEEAAKVDGAAPVAAAKRGLSIRLKILLVALILTVIVAIGFKVQGMILARSLAPFEAQRLSEFTNSPNVGEEYASDVSAEREFGLYGEMLGRVAIFVKSTDPQGDKYAEVDYMYTRDESGGWKFKESGGCADAQCRINALRAFAKKGASK
jgi:hypothetical protein